jgi:hypothetical protein
MFLVSWKIFIADITFAANGAAGSDDPQSHEVKNINLSNCKDSQILRRQIEKSGPRGKDSPCRGILNIGWYTLIISGAPLTFR